MNVLILVLMEDTLRVNLAEITAKTAEVLILVLMEDTLRDMETIKMEYAYKCLNPCFNGRYSQRFGSKIQKPY